MGAEEPGRKRDLVEDHVDGGDTEPGRESRLLRAVAGPARHIGRRRQTQLALPLERIDATVPGGDLAADDRVVVEREVGRVRDVDGLDRRIAPDIHDGGGRAAVVAVDAAADQRHDSPLRLRGVLGAVRVERLAALCVFARENPVRRGARDADQRLRVIAGDEDAGQARAARGADLPHDGIVRAQHEDDGSGRAVHDDFDLCRRVTARAELDVELLVALVQPDQMNLGRLGQAREAARLPLLNAEDDRSDERRAIRGARELQRLQHGKARLGRDAELAEHPRGELLDARVVSALQRLHQRRHGVAPEPHQCLLRLGHDTRIGAGELGDALAGLGGVRAVLQGSGLCSRGGRGRGWSLAARAQQQSQRGEATAGLQRRPCSRRCQRAGRVSRLCSSGVQSTGSCAARAHQLVSASHAHMNASLARSKRRARASTVPAA